MDDAIGEVLTSTITGLVAECWPTGDDNEVCRTNTPRFGSYMRVESLEDEAINIFAVVFDVVTGPQDNMHKPHAMRLTRQQLRLEQPQIFALLKTEMHAAIIGFEQNGVYHTGLPPHPPLVHEFVYQATAAEIVALTEDLDFVRLVARISAVPTDELIGAAIREAANARGGDYPYLLRAGQSLAQTFRDDYERLSSMLRKIRS